MWVSVAVNQASKSCESKCFQKAGLKGLDDEHVNRGKRDYLAVGNNVCTEENNNEASFIHWQDQHKNTGDPIDDKSPNFSLVPFSQL